MAGRPLATAFVRIRMAVDPREARSDVDSALNSAQLDKSGQDQGKKIGLSMAGGLKESFAKIVGKSAGDVKLTVSVSDLAAKMDLASLKAAQEDLAKRLTTIRVGADDKTAQASLLRLNAQMDTLSKKLATPGVELKGFDRMQAQILTLSGAMDKLSAKTATPSVDKGGGLLGGIKSLIPGLGGAAGGTAAGAAGGGAQAGGGIAAALGSNPVTATAGIAAGIAALPFIAQAAAGGITFALGGALAGIAILGASKAKSVQKSFADLKTSASADLAKIGTSFVPVMNSILGTATSVLAKLTPTFAGAARTISGPFRDFADTLLRAFGQPAVQTSIRAVATAFGGILKALTPQLAGDVKSVADGITKVANSVAKNPAAFAGFISFLFKAAGAALTAVAWLTKVAVYVEEHFGPAMHRTAVIFDGVRHDIAHIWDQIWNNSVGMVIRLGHDVERDFNDFRHRTAVIFDGVRQEIAKVWNDVYGATVGILIRLGHNVETQFNSLRHGTAVIFDGARADIAHVWDQIWNNTIGRISRGIGDAVSWFRGLPGQVLGVLSGFGTQIWNWGRDRLTDLLNGVKSVWHDVSGWFAGLPHQILHALGIASPPAWAIDAGKHIMGGILKGLAHNASDVKGFFTGLASDVTGPLKSVWGGITGLGSKVGGFFAHLFGGGGNVASWLTQALAATGTPTSWLPGLETLVGKESGGNPNISNTISVGGQHATGLLQTLPSTFAAFALPGHGNILNPVDNAIASIRYIKATYGSVFSIPGLAGGTYVGYAGGGVIMEPIAGVGLRTGRGYGFGENGPETVTPGIGGSGKQLDRIAALLESHSDLLGTLIGATHGVGGAISGAAYDASFRQRYPVGGA